MVHDVLCTEIDDVDTCEMCVLIATVRAQERASMEGVSSFEVGGLAYARGRQEASDAVKRVRVSSIPMFPGDTPMGLAERIKGLMVTAALCHDVKEKVGPKTLMEVFAEQPPIEP